MKYVEQLSAKLLSLKKSSFVENSCSDISVSPVLRILKAELQI